VQGGGTEDVMMQEKAMVSDALNTLNSGLKTYTDMISQTENQELRSTLQQMRNEAEKSQYELYTIAKNKKYYQPAGQASQNEIDTLKSTFSGSSGWSGSQGMSGQAGTSSSMGMTGNTGASGLRR
jgi:spore coat protein CotF